MEWSFSHQHTLVYVGAGTRVHVRTYEYSTECWAGDKLISATKGPENIINVMDSHWWHTFQNGRIRMGQVSISKGSLNTTIYVASIFLVKQVSEVPIIYGKKFFIWCPEKIGEIRACEQFEIVSHQNPSIWFSEAQLFCLMH